MLGTGLSLKGKTIAITGASGSLGKALTTQLIKQNAKVVALTTNPENISNHPGIKVIPWQLGKEIELKANLEKVDILIINHGINVYGDRTSAAMNNSYEINTIPFATWVDDMTP